METKQPVWKCVGHIGDIDPIAYGGGFVYVDETNIYGPEMTYFEPAPGEQWHETEGESPLQVYRVMLESGTKEWWHDKLSEVASFTGISVADYDATIARNTPLALANMYADLIAYFGAHEFDYYPVTITEDEAYEKFAEEMRLAR